MRFLAVLLGLLLVSATATAEPVEGPLTGSLTLEPGEQVIQPIEILGHGPTLILAQGVGGQIDCALLTSEGEPLAIDTEEDSNECAFRVTPPNTVTVLFVVRNNGDESAFVTAVAR